VPSGSFVVRLVGNENPDPFKQFGAHADAVAYGRNSLQLGEANRLKYSRLLKNYVRAAIVAVKTRKATYVQSRVRHASEREREDRKPFSVFRIDRTTDTAN